MDREKLIDRINYWSERFSLDSIYYKRDFKRTSINVPDDALVELAAFYNELADDSSRTFLTNWLKDRAKDGLVKQRFRRLISLFMHLGGQGCRPFSSQRLKHQTFPEELPDWGMLPPEFASFIPLIDKFGCIPYLFNEDVRTTFLHNLSSDEKEWLLRAYKELGEVGLKNLRSWSSDAGAMVHKEAAMTLTFLVALDAVAQVAE